MKEDEKKQKIALFRYGLIADLTNIPPGTRGLYAKIEKRAKRQYKIPCSDRTTVAAETIRDWLKKYRKGGFDALLPKDRSDRGKPRKLPVHVSDLLLETKEKNPDFTVSMVIKKVLESGRVESGTRLADSTVYKLLARNGLMKKKENAPQDRRRVSYRHGGVMRQAWHNPYSFKAILSTGKRKDRALVQNRTAPVSPPA